MQMFTLISYIWKVYYFCYKCYTLPYFLTDEEKQKKNLVLSKDSIKTQTSYSSVHGEQQKNVLFVFMGSFEN